MTVDPSMDQGASIIEPADASTSTLRARIGIVRKGGAFGKQTHVLRVVVVGGVAAATLVIASMPANIARTTYRYRHGADLLLHLVPPHLHPLRPILRLEKATRTRSHQYGRVHHSTKLKPPPVADHAAGNHQMHRIRVPMLVAHLVAGALQRRYQI
jgi:hypothetical protein